MNPLIRLVKAPAVALAMLFVFAVAAPTAVREWINGTWSPRGMLGCLIHGPSWRGDNE